MSSEEMVRLCKAHTLYTWAKQSAVNPVPIARAEGIYFWTPDGKRYIDFNSQLMSVNIGHHHPKVREAIKRQADELVFAHPQSATAVRARVGKLFADITPDPINTFFFTLGGAEANENAVRAAKLFTGRQKIIVRHRAYHGSTNLTLNMTGDPRRWPNEPAAPGIIRVMDPQPYKYSFGKDAAEAARQNLLYLEEILMYENPKAIAAIVVETVTGTNGILIPETSYMQGLRRMCDEHGIMLICDEVMAGFGRTGKLYAFEHFGIVPDIVTLAKGLTSSYLPLGAVGLSDKVADFFKDNVFAGGLTYNSHPMLLACAEANVEVMLEEKMIENAARMEGVVKEEYARLKSRHPSFKEGRVIGLFGMIDLQKNSAGEPLAPYNGTSPAMTNFAKALDEAGLFSFVRWASFTCIPPLCITEAQLHEAFEIIDRCLYVADKGFEG
ncbi:MAG: aminotransferase class III-fold pyridoxal phosphate-dependent enzyme [Myxococcota bacterium]